MIPAGVIPRLGVYFSGLCLASPVSLSAPLDGSSDSSEEADRSVCSPSSSDEDEDEEDEEAIEEDE